MPPQIRRPCHLALVGAAACIPSGSAASAGVSLPVPSWIDGAKNNVDTAVDKLRRQQSEWLDKARATVGRLREQHEEWVDEAKAHAKEQLGRVMHLDEDGVSTNGGEASDQRDESGSPRSDSIQDESTCEADGAQGEPLMPKDHFSPSNGTVAYQSTSVGYDTNLWDDDEGRCSEAVHASKSNRIQSLSNQSIIYRYFGRRVNGNRGELIPFLVLTPSVDAWRDAGEALSALGFCAVVCERQKNQRGKSSDDQADSESGASIVLRTLDSLRWNRAVIVGCDDEALGAIDAAIHVDREKIAGLVLCGDLGKAHEAVQRITQTAGMRMGKSRRRFRQATSSPFLLDLFLRNNLDGIPHEVIWAGNFSQLVDRLRTSSWRSTDRDERRESLDLLGQNRRIVLGGGLEPQRRLPDQFAWALTRFVDERIDIAPTGRVVEGQSFNLETNQMDEPSSQHVSKYEASHSSTARRQGKSPLFSNPLAPGGAMDCIFSSSSAVVAGRALAKCLLYASMIRVAGQQYQNVKLGLSTVYTVMDIVESTCRHVLSILMSSRVCLPQLERKFRQSLVPKRMSNISLLNVMAQVDEDDEIEEDAGNASDPSVESSTFR